jgi:hypothetical protein
MISLSWEQCREWTLARGIDINQVTSSEWLRIGGTVRKFITPLDAGRINALSMQFCERSSIAEGMVWITQHGIFPSLENTELFYGYRRSLGEARDIHSIPGHVFEQNEQRQFAAILNLGLLFCWDVAVVDSFGARLAFFSHDRWCAIWATEALALNSMFERFCQFGLDALDT